MNSKIVGYYRGDVVAQLFYGNVDCIMHVCNDQGVMGSGIAKQIRDNIPVAFDAYRSSGYKLGTHSIAGGVINLVAQHNYRKSTMEEYTRYLNYGYLAASVDSAFKEIAQYSHNVVVGMPYLMGADRAGGDFEIVMEIVTALAGKYGMTIHVYKRT